LRAIATLRASLDPRAETIIEVQSLISVDMRRFAHEVETLVLDTQVSDLKTLHGLPEFMQLATKSLDSFRNVARKLSEQSVKVQPAGEA
jgi:hypothetical protein